MQNVNRSVSPTETRIRDILDSTSELSSEQIFCNYTALFPRTEDLCLVNHNAWIGIETVPVTAWTGGNSFSYDRIAAFAYLIKVRFFGNLGCFGCAM